MQKVKVLQINAYYGRGSTGNIVKSIEDEGIKQGFDMYSIYWLQPNDKDPTNVYFAGKNEKCSAVKKYMEWIISGGKLSYNKSVTENIVEKILAINPDIIHLHNLHGDFEYGTLDFSILFECIKKMQKRVIWTFHDCWPITGRCYHYEYKKCDKWKTGCGACPQRVFDRQGIFYDYSAQNWKVKKGYYDAIENLTIVTVSNWLSTATKQSMLKNKKIITIYNGVNTDVFSPRNGDESRKKYRILCIGWDRRKGYKDYFELSKLLSPDEEIVVVGKRPGFRKYKRLPSNIVEIDRANSPEQMADIYRSADVYFNASPAETFGLTTVESMCCGVPVIGYNATATPEVINMIENGGMVVNKGDIIGVKRAVEMQRRKEGNVSINDCRQYFELNNMINKYLNLYRTE